MRHKNPTVQTGLSRLYSDYTHTLKRSRVGILCHPASVNEKYQHIVPILQSHRDIDLRAIFSPQHGYAGEKQDNMVESSHFVDPMSGLPVYSLYSETRKPSPDMLKDIDIMLIDLQDVGTRVYTFIYTMALAMEACGLNGVKVVVLDRPNPIGGTLVEGNLLDTRYKSFVGLYPIPMRHGMTVGELATLFNEEYSAGCELEVIEMTSYRRSMWFDETGLPWVLPSPNMPTLDTASVYPGMVLFEGTMVSEGRGSTRPFEIIGSPYIKPGELVDMLDTYELPGILFRELCFEPTFHKFAGEVCGGVQLHVTNRDCFKPYLTGLAVIQSLRRLYPDNFEWKSPPYEYEYEKL
ncbi:MAG: DUF1343 domain-containing protein, partial [Spirochaetota bacterium]|nr:DUF1343 domain-containing protein [Spirochaetota bacterium]